MNNDKVEKIIFLENSRFHPQKIYGSLKRRGNPWNINRWLAAYRRWNCNG